MRLTIIGKYGAYPTEEGGANCYLLRSEKTAAALDFGSGALGGTERVMPLKKLDAVILTHLHYDHMSDILPYIYFAQQNGIKPVLYLPFDNSPQFEIIRASGAFELRCITDGFKTELGDLKLTFNRVPHPAETYAVTVSDGKSTFLYTGDTSWDERFLPLCARAGCVLADAGGFGVHSSVADWEKAAEKTGARIIASHLCPGREYRTQCSKVQIAETGKTYDV